MKYIFVPFSTVMFKLFYFLSYKIVKIAIIFFKCRVGRYSVRHFFPQNEETREEIFFHTNLMLPILYFMPSSFGFFLRGVLKRLDENNNGTRFHSPHFPFSLAAIFIYLQQPLYQDPLWAKYCEN